MKRFLTVLVFLLSLNILAGAAPVASNAAFVIVNDLTLYQDNPDKTLKYLESITLGDPVTLMNKTGTFKEGANTRDFTRVKAPSGKEGWVRTQFIAAKAALAVVSVDDSLVFSEPRDVKVTSKSISPMTVVAVLSDSSTSGFSSVQGYDVPKGVYYTDLTYMIPSDLSTSNADIQIAILYTVAMASKSVDVKKSLLKLALSKYPGSLFISRVETALGAPARVPEQMNADKEGADAVKSFDAVLENEVGGQPLPITKVTATSWLVEPTATHFPKQIADGDTKTSWVEGATGNGIGEKVFLFLETGSVSRISIMPGFGASQAGWNNNNRVSTVTLRFLQVFNNGDYQVIDVNGTDRFILKMATEGGVVPFNKWQTFDLGVGLWENNLDVELVNAVMLEITAVDSKNAKYPDTAIAEVILQ